MGNGDNKLKNKLLYIYDRIFNPKAFENVEVIKPRYVELICNELFHQALQKSPFDVLCTVLRVGGMEDKNWDPFEEVTQSFEDLNWLRRVIKKKRPGKSDVRIALLMYCHAIEISAVHEILLNLLRIIDDQQFHISPFGHLFQKRKKSLTGIPPSAKTKFREIRQKSEKVGLDGLSDVIKNFYNDEIRNAFSHSDYIITDGHLRWRQGGLGRDMDLNRLSELVDHCFAFYGAFLWSYRQWKEDLGKMRKYHKDPRRYEVLEILSDQKHGGVYGFHLHFSNGSKSTYSRTNGGTQAINLHFESDGGINFNCGLIDALKKEWKIDGRPADEVIAEAGER